jgi:hypothetical protein
LLGGHDQYNNSAIQQLTIMFMDHGLKIYKNENQKGLS